MKKLILLRGLPGSGKTTLANFFLDFLLPDLEVHCYSADDYFTEEDGTYNFDINKIGAAHKLCKNRVEDAMKTSNLTKNSEIVIIVHNTFTTEREIKPYTELAETYGFEVTFLFVENRHGNPSIHGVPFETLQKMKARVSIHV